MSTLNKELLELRCIALNYCRITVLRHNKKSSSLHRAVARISSCKLPEGLGHTLIFYYVYNYTVYIYTKRDKNLQKSCQKCHFEAIVRNIIFPFKCKKHLTP